MSTSVSLETSQDLSSQVAYQIWQLLRPDTYGECGDSEMTRAEAAAADVKAYASEWNAANYVLNLAIEHGLGDTDLSQVQRSIEALAQEEPVGDYGSGLPACIRMFQILDNAGVLANLA